jgi:hypothetical protein
MSNSFDTLYSLRKRNLLVQGGRRKKPVSGYSDVILTSSRGLDSILTSTIPIQITQIPRLQKWFNFDASTYVSPGPIVRDIVGNFYIGNIYGSRITKVDGNGNVLQQYFPPTNTVSSSANGGWPWGLVLIGSNLYASDMMKQFIYQINVSTSTFTNIVGSTTGASGYSNGLAGTSSLLNGPMGIASFALGLYITQADNHCISLYNLSTTILSTVAGGGGISGYLDATGTSARFNNPQGLFLDSYNNIIVIDSGNNRIRKITGNVVTTIAGSGQVGSSDGSALLATFDNPMTGCCNISNGDYYIVDKGNLIRKLSNGIVSTILGPSDGLVYITNISIYENILYISDQGSQANPFIIYKYAL